ncbi:MAG: hypothetical protein U5R31_13850 [Acidimicrobiia bacterium]|nr:hypothetical protein [Acidimicrobiia bacterium]
MLRQVVGVSDEAMAERVVGVLHTRGAPRAMVVRGDDGLDELTTTDTTTVHEIRDGERTTWRLDARDLGLARVAPDQLGGGDPEENARLTAELLSGAPGPTRDIVVLNAAAGLVVAGVADDFERGVAAAQASIDEGRAKAVLDRLVTVSASATA